MILNCQSHQSKKKKKKEGKKNTLRSMVASADWNRVRLGGFGV